MMKSWLALIKIRFRWNWPMLDLVVKLVNLILVSSRNVDFHVIRALLKDWLWVFKTLTVVIDHGSYLLLKPDFSFGVGLLKMIVQVTLGGKPSFTTLKCALIGLFTSMKSEVCFEIPFFKKCLSAVFYGTEVLSFTFMFVHMDLKPL